MLTRIKNPVWPGDENWPLGKQWLKARSGINVGTKVQVGEEAQSFSDKTERFNRPSSVSLQ